MKVSEFKSNYCFRIQILNVIEHRVTERMSEDSEYPLLKHKLTRKCSTLYR